MIFQHIFISLERISMTFKIVDSNGNMVNETILQNLIKKIYVVHIFDV